MATPSSNAAHSLSLDEIEAAAARLSADERGELVQFLIDLDHPADPEVEAAWDQEINRRLNEVRSGKVTPISRPPVRSNGSFRGLPQKANY